MILIGISGKKRSGKDTVAGFIRAWGERHGWTVQRRAFADPLKEEVVAWITCELIRSGFEAAEAREKAVLLVHDEGQKAVIRPLLQWWGTEFRREMFGSDYWLNRMAEWLEQPLPYPARDDRRIVVVPDVRFADEFDFIRQRGGLLIRVNRPGTCGDQHASETALDGRSDWDWWPYNDGTREELKQRTFDFCEDELEKR